MCVFMKVEEKCSVLSREKNELQSRTEENDEEVDELMRKFKAAVQQVRSFTYSLSLST